jgi:ABC-type multidrug transport system ATPase subunit
VQAGAKILCLDEPLAGLDEDGIREVMGMLQKLAQEEQVTLVIVEHVLNIPHVLGLATTVWTLEDGKILVASMQLQSQRSDLGGISQWLSELEGEVIRHDLPGNAVLRIVRLPGIRIGEVVLSVRNLVVYRGKRSTMGGYGEEGEGLSFEIRQGELVILEAPNGWGKTTLLEALMGLVPIFKGIVKLENQDIQDLASWKRAVLGIAFLQSRNNLFNTLTVKELLRLNQVNSIPTKIQNFVGKHATDLSGGERQRLMISCIFDSKPFKLALLDEPFLALDGGGATLVREFILEGLTKASLLLAIPQY